MINTINMVQYHKGKCYFDEKVQGQIIKARTACLILRYKDSHGELNVLTILESSSRNILEFPGGKVEPGDLSAQDTLLRESWEEIVLKDNIGKDSSLQNWRDIYNNIISNDDIDSKLFVWIETQLSRCLTATYGNCPLRTIYYIVDINNTQAKHLIENHGMVPFSVEFMKTIVLFNKKTKDKSKRFTRRTTNFIINEEVYQLRGRDFEGMFKYVTTLEQPAKKDWSLCRSPKSYIQSQEVMVQ